MLIFEVATPENRHLIPSSGWFPENISINVNGSVVESGRAEGLSQIEALALGGDVIFLIFLVVLVSAGLLMIYLYGLASSISGLGSFVDRDVREPSPEKYLPGEYIYRGWRKELRYLYLKFLKKLRDRGIYLMSGYTAYEVAKEASKADVSYAPELARLYNFGMFSSYSDESVLEGFKRYLGDEG